MPSVLSHLEEDFGIEFTSVEPVNGGVDWAAQNFLGHSPTRRYAIKWSSCGSVAGLVVPNALAASGVRAVTAPVPTRGDPRRVSRL